MDRGQQAIFNSFRSGYNSLPVGKEIIGNEAELVAGVQYKVIQSRKPFLLWQDGMSTKGNAIILSEGTTVSIGSDCRMRTPTLTGLRQ